MAEDDPLSPVHPPVRDSARLWAKRAGYVALGAIGSYLTLCASVAFPLASHLIRPRLKRLPQLKSKHLRTFLAQRNVPFEEITFRSFDGTRLDGWWFEVGPDRPTVIALHGVTKNRIDMVRFAIALTSVGVNVLTFDGRGHGHSDRTFVTYGFYEKRDVDAAIDYLVMRRGVDDHKIGLAGISMGAAISLQVAASNPRIRAVWTDSPFASLTRVSMDHLRSWTKLPSKMLVPVVWAASKVAEQRGRFDVRAVDPLALARKITCPVYLIHSDADAVIGLDHSRHIFDALPVENKEMWELSGIAHGRGFRRMTDEYAARLVRFFQDVFALRTP